MLNVRSPPVLAAPTEQGSEAAGWTPAACTAAGSSLQPSPGTATALSTASLKTSTAPPRGIQPSLHTHTHTHQAHHTAPLRCLSMMRLTGSSLKVKSGVGQSLKDVWLGAYSQGYLWSSDICCSGKELIDNPYFRGLTVLNCCFSQWWTM